jgi:cellulose synthase/poly-beta-1,6-N-acetylglucosamine synthase-like glycosyltransferase
MNDSCGAAVFVLEILLGLLVAIVLLARCAVSHLEKELADYERPITQLQLEPENTTGIFLRWFNSPQRAYLRQQHRWIAGCIFCLWLSLLFFSLGFSLEQQKPGSYGFALSQPQSVWNTYLRFGFVWNQAWPAFLAAVFALVSVRQKDIEPRFIRTRR